MVFSCIISMCPFKMSWVIAGCNGEEHPPDLESIFMDYVPSTGPQ